MKQNIMTSWTLGGIEVLIFAAKVSVPVLLCYSYVVCFSLWKVLFRAFMVTLVASHQQGCWVDSDWRPFRVVFLCTSRAPAGAHCGCSGFLGCACQANKQIKTWVWMYVISSLMLGPAANCSLIQNVYKSGGRTSKSTWVYISPCFMRHTKCISNVDLLADIQFRCAANLLNASPEGIPIWFITGEFWCKRKFL